MKLSELATEHNLDPDLLREVVEEDLSISLPKGMDTPLKQDVIDRILSCDGLETTDGKPFTPIIAKEFEEKHKRSIAAKKAAETRKKKAQKEEEKRAEEAAKIAAEERRKHEEELARREAERVAREEAEAVQAERAAQAAGFADAEIEAARREAEEELARREAENRRLAAQFAAMRGKTSEPAEGQAPTAPAASAATADAPAVSEMPAVQAPAAETPVEAPAKPAEPVAARSIADAVAKAPAETAPQPEKAKAKGLGLGSRLASLAKATHEKADHSLKVEKKDQSDPHGATITKTGNDAELSPEDRKRLIQENIRKNLAMAQKVKDIKAAERGRRRPGFQTIDRSKTPGGPPGPGGRGPGRGGPGRPGGPGGPARGPRRDNRDHRLNPDEVDENGRRVGGRRRPLSTEEQDLSGKTEFSVSLPCTVREFSEASGIKSSVVIAKLFMAGMMANINSALDKDTCELLAQEFKKEISFVEARSVEDELLEQVQAQDDNEEDLAPRPPVVTIMGHVDHGKTSLLDAIRKTQFTADEAGGITQHIGAYTVTAPNGMEVTFIDTPGHEAFTAMRARGAKITDVAVIVVDAVDGLMPQTIEAINHAKAAGVAIVVAMNKIDKPEATKDAQERVLRQLAEQGLQAEEWGGEVGVIRVSALKSTGIDDLLERLALETEVLELRSNHFANASGVVIEAHRHEGQGVTATLLIQRGSLAIGDVVLAGVGYGRVRALTDWTGARCELAGPSHAVEVIGLSELPNAGDHFVVVADLKQAAQAAEDRTHRQRERELQARSKVTTAANVFGAISDLSKKEVKVIVKCDASGSLEVLRHAIGELNTDEVSVAILHSGVGAITSTDITLAEASRALVVGFHVIADSKARAQADQGDIEIRTYTVIYELLDDLKKAMTGMLEPEYIEKVIGHAEVRATFNISKVGVVAGLFVTDGKVIRDCGMRLTRDHVITHTGTVNTLRRFKEDVKEVRDGFECGMTITNYQDVQVGDVIEFFTKEKRARTL